MEKLDKYDQKYLNYLLTLIDEEGDPSVWKDYVKKLLVKGFEERGPTDTCGLSDKDIEANTVSSMAEAKHDLHLILHLELSLYPFPDPKPTPDETKI